MNRIRITIITIFILSSLITIELPSQTIQSSHARVVDGMGNIIVGDHLPYNDEAAWEGLQGDTISSDFLHPANDYESLALRAFLPQTVASYGPDQWAIWVLHYEIGDTALTYLTASRLDDPEIQERTTIGIQATSRCGIDFDADQAIPVLNYLDSDDMNCGPTPAKHDIYDTVASPGKEGKLRIFLYLAKHKERVTRIRKTGEKILVGGQVVDETREGHANTFYPGATLIAKGQWRVINGSTGVDAKRAAGLLSSCAGAGF